MTYFYIMSLKNIVQLNHCTKFRVLVEPLSGSHGRLDVQGTDVLPILLQQRNKEVDAERDVRDQLILGHVDVPDRDSQTKNLLHLELDGCLHFLDLSSHGLAVSQHRWKLSSFVQTWTDDTRNLLDERIRRQERIVLLRQLLDEFFILVQLLESFGIHTFDVVGLGFIAMLLITEDADGHLGARDVTQLHCTRETLVLLGIVVFQRDLQLHCFCELSLLLCTLCQHGTNSFVQTFTGHLAHFLKQMKNTT